MDTRISILINGTPHQATLPIRTLLVDFIRDQAGLTGTHVGCTFEGVCGACTVHLDGEAVKSCLLLAAQANGREITTIEGIAPAPHGGEQPELHALQRAFQRCAALQCGYCTPGVLMNAVDFLRTTPDPSAQEIREALVGNLCRCTGYSHIVEAIQMAAAELRGAEVAR